MLNCNQPVTNREQLAGKRLRTDGSQWSRWAQQFGASPVTLSGNEAFEALDQGVVDCVIISAPDLESLGIIDATTDITTNTPGGPDPHEVRRHNGHKLPAMFRARS